MNEAHENFQDYGTLQSVAKPARQFGHAMQIFLCL